MQLLHFTDALRFAGFAGQGAATSYTEDNLWPEYRRVQIQSSTCE